MNILFVIRSLDCGGAERQLTLLANRLAARDHQVTIAVFYSGGVRERDLADGKVKLVDLRKRSRFDLVQVAERLGALVRQMRPDIVHGYLTAGNLAALSSRAFQNDAKVIWAVRDSNMDRSQYSLMTRTAAVAAGWLSKLVDGIIANSAVGMRLAVETGYPSQRSIHIPNGIDVGVFKPNAVSGKLFREKLGLRDSEKLIGLVGRLDPMKDHQTFLTAASTLAAVRQDVRFLCIGSGSPQLATSLKQHSASLGIANRVIWQDSVSDMPAAYSALDVFCLSSQFGEGFPNVLGEAMACARPSVATDVGDSAYVAGGTAKIVPPRNPKALAEQLLGELERGERPEARERIVNHFSVDEMVNRTEEALARWCGKPVYQAQLASATN